MKLLKLKKELLILAKEHGLVFANPSFKTWTWSNATISAKISGLATSDGDHAWITVDIDCLGHISLWAMQEGQRKCLWFDSEPRAREQRLRLAAGL